MVTEKKNPGCLIQILWFAFIGIWLGQVWMLVAWVLMLTIVGIPLGVMMLNKIPWIIALRSEPLTVRISKTPEGELRTQTMQPAQVPMILRVLYFILIGWWLSALWMEAAYALCVSIIGLPIGFWMFDRVPAILSLRM
jgi:uncharacterized membrane protein YccF (DUF307 family)